MKDEWDKFTINFKANMMSATLEFAKFSNKVWGTEMPEIAAMAPGAETPMQESQRTRRDREFAQNGLRLDPGFADYMPELTRAVKKFTEILPAIGTTRATLEEKMARRAAGFSFIEDAPATSDSPKPKSVSSVSDEPARDLRDVVNSDLVRIGGARGIGGLGDQGLEIQKSQDQKLGTLIVHAKATADALGKWAYA